MIYLKEKYILANVKILVHLSNNLCLRFTADNMSPVNTCTKKDMNANP